MNNYIWKPVLPPFRRHKKKVFSEIIDTSGLVYQIGESDILRKPSHPVSIKEIKTKELQEKIAYLKKVLIKYRKLTGKGRGITAVQVGIPQRFSIVYMPITRKTSKEKINVVDLLVIINPHITKKSTELYRYPEICMSANPIVAPVIRPAWIEFEYYDEKGEKKYWSTKDLNKKGRMSNRVFQREIDHMEGIINIDLCDSKKLIFESAPKFYKKADFTKM